MRIIYKLDLDDRVRRAVRQHVGMSGLATRHEVRAALDSLVDAWIEDLMFESDEQEEDEGEEG